MILLGFADSIIYCQHIQWADSVMIVISARRKPGGDHGFGRVNAGVCVYLSAEILHIIGPISLILFCTFMTICSRTSHGCGD